MARAVPTWLQDQHEAAARELRPFIESLRRAGLPHRAPAGSAIPREVVAAAIARRTRTYCPHCSSAAPPPLVINLPARWCICKPCLSDAGVYAYLELVGEDDGRCDLCDSASDWFLPAAVKCGPALVIAEMCRECASQWLPESL